MFASPIEELKTLKDGNYVLGWEGVIAKIDGRFKFNFPSNFRQFYYLEGTPTEELFTIGLRNQVPSDYVLNKFFGIPYNQDNMIN